MEAISATPMGSSLYGGFTGIAWSIAHLGGWFLDADDDATEAVDQVLRDYVGRKSWRGDYDLIGGLVGFGVYALERLPNPLAIECLEHVVDRLNEIAERTPEGIAWFTRPELLPDWQRELCPLGYYNLGVAHGVPGVIAFLGQVCAFDSKGLAETSIRVQKKALLLLDGAVSWLLTQKCADTTVSIFPSWTGPGITPEPSLVAWCYGDLGIAAALMVAARCVNQVNWEREVLALARHVAKRPVEQSGIRDCGLCHGAAGAGHLFNRLFQATGEVSLRKAAQYWFQRTLEMRRPGQGIAGFRAFRPTPDGRGHWAAELGILEGAAGVALALLAAATDVEPAWDRMMLVSGPSRPRQRSV
jgi:lantibiotic biosynthesis protein